MAANDGDDIERLERERHDADRQYNDALTAFDSALIPTRSPADSVIVADSKVPELPGGWRGWRLRGVQQWLMPWLERQQTFNVHTSAAFDTLVARERERSAAFERFQSALIAFLQRITALVETKDRQLTAIAARRLDRQQQVLDTLPDLQAQVAVLQRATHMLTRKFNEGAANQPPTTPAATPAGSPAHERPAARQESIDDYKYVGFEDQFRGSDESVAAKLADYLPLFTGASDVVDLGCGRGEFLAALKSAGIRACGVDTNAEMVAIARERGLDVTESDALTYVAARPDESIGGAIAAQVVEHLEPSYLIRLLESLARTLRSGAPIVIETINPACWYAFFSSYIRDLTHVRPIHPETLQYLLRASGFERVEIRYRTPLPDHMKMKTFDLPAAVRSSNEPSAVALAGVAQTLNANAVILNNLLFSYMDYAVIGYRS